MGLAESKIIVGAGGTGKTTLLQKWIQSVPQNTSIAQLTGHPKRFVSLEILAETIETNPTHLVLDDLQWFTDTALDLLATIGTAQQTAPTIWASRRPWPENDSILYIEDLMQQKEVLGFLDTERLATCLSSLSGKPTNIDTAEWFHQQTGGSLGFCADILDSNWEQDKEHDFPQELIPRILSRVKKTDRTTEMLTNYLSLPEHIGLQQALSFLPPEETPNAERTLRASGLLRQDETLIPVVSAAIEKSLTVEERKTLYTTIASQRSEPSFQELYKYAHHAQNSTNLTNLYTEAAEKYWHKKPAETLQFIKQAQEFADEETNKKLSTLQAYAQFLLNVPIAGPIPEEILCAQAVANIEFPLAEQKLSQIEESSIAKNILQILQGNYSSLSQETTPTETVSEKTLRGLHTVIKGGAQPHIELSTAATQRHRSSYIPTGRNVSQVFEPSFFGALGLLAYGDKEAAQLLLTAPQKTDFQPSRSITLLNAHIDLLNGKYKEAVAILQAETFSLKSPNWTRTEQLLWTSLHAALALRSGDISKIRTAWQESQLLLLQISPSWLHLEIFQSLLVAGARLGNSTQVHRTVAALDQQCVDAPNPDLSIAAWWMRLHIALAEQDTQAANNVGELLLQEEPQTTLARLRQEATVFWLQINNEQNALLAKEEQALLSLATRMREEADPWQASRLLGQAALHVDDPKLAKKLLEQARSSVMEITNDENEGLKTAGLSERETEVSTLMLSGKTYKQIGEQLFISPKTVEHHVARIKQKVSAKNRIELFDKLRNLLS